MILIMSIKEAVQEVGAAAAGGGNCACGPDGRVPSIALRNARVHAEGTERTLLDIAALELFAGERVVVTGLSGSGKSLLLATLSGRWAAGLSFTGERTTDLTRIGFIPQRGMDALHPLSKLERQLAKVSGKNPEQVSQVLEAVGLGDAELRRRRPAELSGGQAQRATIALAVLTEAPLILADEPTSALDHETRDKTLRLLDQVIGKQQTLVVATHDWAVARVLATRHLVIDDGKMREISIDARGQHA